MALPPSLLSAAQTGNLTDLSRDFDSLQQPKKRDALAQLAREAAKSDHPQVLEFCFSHGFSVPRTTFNHAFYHAACDGESPAIFQVLLDHGFDLNGHESEYSGDALVSATRSGNVTFANFLLEHGQNPSAHRTVYAGDLEALTYAIAGEHPSHEMLALLIKHGAEVRKTGAACAAAETGRLEDLRLLVEQGQADVEEAKY